MVDEQITRAGILMFHPKPEKLFPGAFIKIGFFRSDSDLAFQDEVHGSLVQQVDRTFDLLTTKYMNYMITYQGLQRVETPTFPEDPLRECILNAVAHKDYQEQIPIQISVYPDRIVFWNPGELPESWTVESLLKKHPSKAFNPAIANAFFRCGEVEARGRGIGKIVNGAIAEKLLPPVFDTSFGGLMVTFYNSPAAQLKEAGISERGVQAVEFALKDFLLIAGLIALGAFIHNTVMKTAIIFSRCSSSGALEARQDTTRQVEDLQHYATTNHLSIVKIFQEHISGGKANKDRPILQEALSFCQENSIDIILVSELSRLGRRCDEILETIKYLKDNHINCYFQKEQLSIFDTEGKENPYLTIMTAVLGTAAELERQSIYYRLKSGRDKYIRDGGKVGKPKGAGIKDKAQLASEYKSIIRCLRSGESVRHTALITGYSQSTVQRVKKVFAL